ncbi:hypothetical protein BGZ47_006840 [Haplosporangium gracile]|nr:hypothetical protein BGZ47_006840 [Haplosporangium gracile]
MATMQASTSFSSSTSSNTPSTSEINSIIPGTIFPDDSPLSSFIDSGELPYDSPSSSSPSPHTANKSGEAGGGGGEHIGQIEVNSTIQTILVVLGFGVGALFLLGVVAMYYISHKNKRAEEKKKQREEEAAAGGMGGAKAGRNSISSPLGSSSNSPPLPSHPNISAGTGTVAAAAAGGRENPVHRIIITRSMTATTANTRVGAGGANGCDEKDGSDGSGGLSPIGDGKSDMVTIHIDEMPDDEIHTRHHCDDDDMDNSREKQELNEDEMEGGNDIPSQERARNMMNPYPSPHNSL